LHRQVNKPHFTQSERLWLGLLASRVRHWKDVLLILKPDTLLLYRVIKEYVEFFNEARPYQGIEQKIPEGIQIEEKENPIGKIVAFPVLNGLHRNYRRAA
jgi:hypothetical protein